MKTTKEQRDEFRRIKRNTHWAMLYSKELSDLCDDIDALEKENAELRAKFDGAYSLSANLAYTYMVDNGLRDHARRLEQEILSIIREIHEGPKDKP